MQRGPAWPPCQVGGVLPRTSCTRRYCLPSRLLGPTASPAAALNRPLRCRYSPACQHRLLRRPASPFHERFDGLRNPCRPLPSSAALWLWPLACRTAQLVQSCQHHAHGNPSPEPGGLLNSGEAGTGATRSARREHGEDPPVEEDDRVWSAHPPGRLLRQARCERISRSSRQRGFDKLCHSLAS